MYSMNHGAMHNSRKRRSEEEHQYMANSEPTLSHHTSHSSLYSNFDGMDTDMDMGVTEDMELTSPANSPPPSAGSGTGWSHDGGFKMQQMHSSGSNRHKRVQHSPVDGYAHVVTMHHLDAAAAASAASAAPKQEPCAANGFTPSPAGLVENICCQQCDKDLAKDDIYYYDNYTCISCSSIVCRRCSISSIYRTDLYCLGCYRNGC